MAENFNSIKDTILKYILALKQNRIDVERVYLFGSYARGNAEKDSDIDLAIISRDFSGMRFEDRRILVPLRRKIDSRIDPIPFRPEDFQGSSPLVNEILSYGIELKV